MKTLSNQKLTKIFLLLSCVILTYAFTFKNAGGNPVWKAPAAADANKNLLKGNAGAIAEGKKTYNIYCVACHGTKGKGDGVAAAGLQRAPADHTSAAVQSQSDGAIFWKISEGRNPMPSYKTMLTETQRWQLVNYIRTLAKPSK